MQQNIQLIAIILGDKLNNILFNDLLVEIYYKFMIRI